MNQKKHMSPLEVIGLYPDHHFTLTSLLKSRLDLDPSRPFIIFNEKTITWGEFATARDKTAQMLLARGVKKGDRIAIMAHNHDAHVLLLFSLARIGAIMVPVNPEFGVEEAKYILNHSGALGIFCSAQTYPIAKEATQGFEVQPWFCSMDGEIAQVPDLMQSISAPKEIALPEDVFADDICVLVYSSGTTGFPKGVMHSQRNLVLCAERQVARVELQPDDRCMCVLPMFHVNALFYSILGTVAAGCCLVIVGKFSASKFWETVAKTGTTQVNLIMAVTSILARRSREGFVPGVRLRCVSGSPFTKETMDVFLNEFGVERVIEGFGMTEIPGAFSNPYDGPHLLASMGYPGKHPDPDMTWTEARVVDDDGIDVPHGTTGELVVKIPTMMKGYFNDPEQTAAAFRDGWFLTGDLVYRTPEGCFYFVARKKDIIRRRGENIAGAELDRIIGQHPNVLEVATIATDSELGEDEIMAVVVPRPGTNLVEEDVRTWCTERLAAHKIPRFVIFVDKLPYTPTHKIAKFVLKKDPSLRARAIDFQNR
jgi:crotonobetaine/carnitine-CoA ligase